MRLMPDMTAIPDDPPARQSRRTNGAEHAVGQALKGQLLRGEVLLEGVRFSDPRHGDVEVDFLVLFPDAGVAVIEVKGGAVSFADGQWLTQNKDRSRRIDPIRQARGAKHALRRYLDRQDQWHHGLVRSEWFIAMPDTVVVADMGPEARREMLLGADDIDDMRTKIRLVLMSSLNRDEVPPDGWVDDAVSLLLRGDRSSTGCEVRGIEHLTAGRGRVFGWVAASLALIVSGVLSLGANVVGGWLGFLVLATALIAGGIFVRRSTSVTGLLANRRTALATGVGLVLGLVLALGIYGPGVGKGNCHSGYLPCVPIADNVDCSDLRMVVRVVGTDDYGLDRDGDGVGCESYA
jgi:hypothetical protein